MATAYITRTPAGTGNQRTFTMSYWLKRAAQGVGDNFYSQSGGKCYMEFTSGDVLNIGMNTSGTSVDAIRTNRMFRDPAAWYHIVLKMDTTQSTEADRMRIYINGVEEVAANWSTTNYPAEDADILINTTLQYYIGSQTASTNYFSGEMSHVQFVDGLALAPTEFGEVDATSGIWKLKTSCYATPGTNGFCLKMQDRTNLDLDSSSNAFTFTTSGTLTPTYDNPSDNFCTLNPLANYINGSTFTQGNNTMTTRNGDRSYNIATMGLTSGKWYFETYMNALVSGSGQNTLIGIADAETTAVGNQLGILATQYGYYSTTGGSYNSDTDTSYGDTYTTGDYIGTYIDLDNNKIYWAKNGTIQNSGTGVTITAPSAMTGNSGGAYLPALGFWSSIPVYKYDVNFGNGYFGTTVISSPEDDAGGIGAFKYDPSTGTFDGSSKDFRAICTKNIKAYGG